MDFALVAVAAVFASALTLYSGFGLGTLLLPVFALFFPPDLAVGATALVHGANNVLKVALLGRKADLGVVLRFGVPAILAALVGAWVLGLFAHLEPLATYPLLGRTAVVTPVKVALGLLMAAFAVLELSARFAALTFPPRWLPLGGVLSGFFGGLSGHQGALRSAFLAKTGLPPPALVATNAVLGLLVDLTRIGVYAALLAGGTLSGVAGGREGALIAVGVLAAFAGVLVGRRWLHKVTLRTVQRITGTLLLVVALLLASGWI